MKIEIDVPQQDIVLLVRVPGEPQAWLRAGRCKGRTFNPKANIDAREHVRWAIKSRHPEFPDAMDCANRFGVAAIFETCKWDSDADNYLKQLLDALQGYVFKNDRQVDKIFAHVERDAEKPNQQIIVYKTRCALGGKQI